MILPFVGPRFIAATPVSTVVSLLAWSRRKSIAGRSAPVPFARKNNVVWLAVAPFGVKVCALEPGGMGTNWGARANKETPDLLPDYEPSVGAVVKALGSYWGQETSDPAKVAQVVLRLAASDSLPAHLLPGSDAVQFAGQAEATRAADAERWREISVSTDVNAVEFLPALRF